MMKTRIHFIEENEALLTQESIRGGKPFLGESPYIGKTMTIFDVLDEGLEHVTKIMRMNIDTMAVEDVTEIIAQAWINRTDAEHGCVEECPVFVGTSHAFQIWCAIPDSYVSPSYSTLNNTTAGIQSTVSVFRRRHGMPMHFSR